MVPKGDLALPCIIVRKSFLTDDAIIKISLSHLLTQILKWFLVEIEKSEEEIYPKVKIKRVNFSF